MKRISKYPRLLGPRMLVAFLAAAFASAVPASVYATPYANDVLLRIVNNSDKTVTMSFCPGGHVSLAYKIGTREDPCDRISETSVLEGHGGVWQSRAGVNPSGAIMRAKGVTVYLYASNPPIGKPFFEINRKKVAMSEGALEKRNGTGATFLFHREKDRDSMKIMTIEIIKVP